MNNIETYQDIIARLYPETRYQKNQTANITFQITDDCNLKCSYCYQINKGNHIMPIEVAKKFIDLILQPNKNAKKYLNSLDSTAVILDFIGGEPLLQIDLIDEIIDYFIGQTITLNHPWQYNYRISICSNGTLYFNDKVQKFLTKYKDVLSFSISIDGNKELHDKCRVFPNGEGSYNLAVSAAKDYMSNNKINSLGTKMTLSPDNINYTKDAIINLINIGYTNIFLNCIFEKGWEYEHATILYNQLKKLTDYIINNNLENIDISIFDKDIGHPKSTNDSQNWCGGNGQMIALDYKGDIYPCLRYMESSLGNKLKPLIIGNVNRGLLSSPKDKNIATLVSSVNRLTQSSKECIDCVVAEGCAWCQAYNYQDSNGNINHRATYICPMHKARVLANVYYWNMRYKKYNENKRFKMWLPDEEALKIISQEEIDYLHSIENDIGVELE